MGWRQLAPGQTSQRGGIQNLNAFFKPWAPLNPSTVSAPPPIHPGKPFTLAPEHHIEPLTYPEPTWASTSPMAKSSKVLTTQTLLRGQLPAFFRTLRQQSSNYLVIHQVQLQNITQHICSWPMYLCCWTERGWLDDPEPNNEIIIWVGREGDGCSCTTAIKSRHSQTRWDYPLHDILCPWKGPSRCLIWDKGGDHSKRNRKLVINILLDQVKHWHTRQVSLYVNSGCHLHCHSDHGYSFGNMTENREVIDINKIEEVARGVKHEGKQQVGEHVYKITKWPLYTRSTSDALSVRMRARRGPWRTRGLQRRN